MMKVTFFLFTAMLVANMSFVSAGWSEGEEEGKGKSRRRRGRKLLIADEDMWEDMKDQCSDVVYDIKLVAVKETGHLEGYAAPRIDDTTSHACTPVISHVVNQANGPVKRIEVITNEREAERYWSIRESTELGARTFKEIATAVDAVEVSGNVNNAFYPSALVEKNCGTYLLELGWNLRIPVNGEIGAFVSTHMQETKFMKTFTDSAIYKTLSSESWFGRRLGDDADTMVRRLFEYMVEQQYPEDLVHFD